MQAKLHKLYERYKGHGQGGTALFDALTNRNLVRFYVHEDVAIMRCVSHHILEWPLRMSLVQAHHP